jgi:methionyl-tRNA formyltransferase
MARVAFMGTPDFALPALRALHEQHQVVGVVTQPDRAAGRGRAFTASPVKGMALSLGVPVYQPETLRRQESIDILAAWRPEVIVVAAFGQILPAAVLAIPPHGCLNVHASLLPRYRGAAPIAAAILTGESVTGVTIMHMDEGMDTGPILVQAEVPIEPEDTTGSLTTRLAQVGAELLVEALPGWLSGRVTARAQDPLQATYCRPLRKEDGRIDWTRPALHLERLVRACHPWPGVYTEWQGQRLKVLRAHARPQHSAQDRPGLVLAAQGSLSVASGEGLLELLEVQLAGKKPLTAALFARGHPTFAGSLLGQ